MPILTSRPAGVRGFTLVEILIVVVILGILAAIVIPQFSSAAEQSRRSSMEQSIHRIRQQLEVYAAHHHGTYPADDAFAAQMTQPTDAHGNPPAEGEPSWGPYLHDVPPNPYTSTNTVSNTAFDGTAWLYAAGDFRANDTAAHAKY